VLASKRANNERIGALPYWFKLIDDGRRSATALYDPLVARHPSMIPLSELASAMKAKRGSLKLTQAEMAAELGISREMVSMIESGRKARRVLADQPILNVSR
jgi:DNA-binding XRE family transcriptional regulator